MSDLIKRQDAIDAVSFGITYAKAFNVITGETVEPFKKTNQELEKAINRIEELPSAKPERKTGHWIVTDGEIRRCKHYKCSECAHEFDWIYDPMFPPVFNYCPKCGADMRGKI